jgi:probable O-glycosylation ligase (exosortase A-associated)
MRDLAVILLFSGAGLYALRKPYIAALLWTWIGLMNPHRLGWGMAYEMPFAMAAGAILVFSMLINSQKVRWTFAYPTPVLLVFIAWMGITTAFAIFASESLSRYVEVLKVLLMLIPLAAVIRTREEILGLIVVVAGSLAFFGIKGGIFTAVSGGDFRVWGPPASVIEGNNELAVALIITVPLIYFLATQAAALRTLPVISRVSEKWIKLFMYLSMFLCLISAIGSHSRGALLAMVAMGSILWWRSKAKMSLAIVALVMGLIGTAFMPEHWMTRMNTIQTYEEDASAMGRINAWTMAINIANDRPTGAGFVTDSPVIYQSYAPNPSFVIVAHSIYFQVLGEHGYIGLILYLAFWISTYMLAGRIGRQTAKHPELGWANTLASMSKVSLVGFAVGGAFLSLAYWDMPFYIFVALICTHRWVREALGAQATPGANQQNMSSSPSLQAGIQKSMKVR